MTRADYQRRAECYSELLTLAIREGDFSQVEEFQKQITQAIEKMRDSPQ